MGHVLGIRAVFGCDTRLEVEESAIFSRVSFRTECFYAWFNPDREPIVGVHASGFYVQEALRFRRKFQGVAKYERFDPYRAIRNRYGLRWTTVGLNWLVRQNRIRLGTGYVFKGGS